jgi:AcrR family transcriptional regulator
LGVTVTTADRAQATTRRRGAALEAAILEAGWDQLAEFGAQGFTFEAVAERARTGKPVLYRRWPTRQDLLVAVLRHRVGTVSRAPDTGSLRGDVLALLRSMNSRRGDDIPALISGVFGAYFAATGEPPAELRALVLGDRRSTMSSVIERAVQRGELPSAEIPERVLNLPADLLRHELIMQLRAVPDETIVDIVDNAFLPLVQFFAHQHIPPRHQAAQT